MLLFDSRVCNSDVASDSSSEYQSEEEKDDLSAEAPICLKAKASHTLAYVPSMFDRSVGQSLQITLVDISSCLLQVPMELN